MDVAEGLTSGQAEELLRSTGPNEVPRSGGSPIWRLAARQFLHFFALMLWTAALLALLAGAPQLAVAICLIIVINGLFAFAQEYRAERAADRLLSMLPVRARVRRDGRDVLVDATTLVPGDLAILSEGDRVTADMRCVSSESLEVDTSALTGETTPERPATGDELAAGSYVLAGAASARVVATGRHTGFARLVRLTAATTRPRTPLESDIRRLVRRLATVALTVGAVFVGIMVLMGASPATGLLFGIGVIVALVPEGLLPTVTLSLAVAAQRMSREKALVRRLEAVETLGATTVICTDKTGTLTQNQMTVVEAWTPAGHAAVEGPGYAPQAVIRAAPDVMPSLREMATAARLCSEGRVALDRDDRWTAHGDPMDAAVDALAHRLHLPDAGAPLVLRPFHRAFMAMEADTPGRSVMKGAPEAVATRCGALDPAA